MNAGYKGVVIHQKSWQDKLRDLEQDYAVWFKIGDRGIQIGLEGVTKMMKAWYPGNYKVIEAYDPKRGVFGFKLVFDDPKEETFWLVKWS